MNTHTLLKTAGAAIVLSALLPLAAAAQVTTSAAANVGVNAGGAHATVIASSTVETTRAAAAKEKADQEIDRRVAALNVLLARVNAMAKVSDTFKSNLTTNIKTEIDGFAALKAKVDADTDVATLKTDVKSITDSYRIFMLVIPQGRISAAADRTVTIINMMVTVGTKLQARINTAKTGGADTTALEAALTDLGTKLQSAQTHAQAAVGDVAPLVPDNGDATVQASNTAALKSGIGEIKGGQSDLASGRKDIATIIAGLGKLKLNANTSTSAGTQ